MAVNDPEQLALLLVQQFLEERGYSRALREIEKSHGLRYVDEKLPQGSMLMQLVYGHLEREAASGDTPDAADCQAEEERLLQGGTCNYPGEKVCQISGRHRANITSVSFVPGRDMILTGAGDGTVQAFDLEGKELWAQTISHGGAITLAPHPHSSCGDLRLLVGSMDGSVSLLSLDFGEVLHIEKVHTKYVIRVCWSPQGHYFVSGSWDGEVNAFETPGSPEGSIFVKVASLPFPSAVQDVAFLPGAEQLVIALRDTHLLRLRKFPKIEEADEDINMNAAGDHHVSFSARQLDISADEKYLLVSTDSPRILLLRIKGWSQLRCQMFGLPMDTFHTAVALWHTTSFYIMAAAAGGQVFVFHTGSGKVIAKIRAHTKNVRWLAYDANRNLLLSCSFDRTVNVYAHRSAGMAAIL